MCRLCLERHRRHTFASLAGDLGYSELTIAGLLGHSARGVTQGYVHLDTALIAAADRISSELARLLDSTDNVKPSKNIITPSKFSDEFRADALCLRVR